MSGPVLVVEDDALLREMVEIMLATAGRAVVAVADGPAALACVEAVAPAVVLLDISMPGMSGLDVLEALRTTHGYRGPVLVMTAHHDRTTAQRVMDLGGDGYIAKPFTREDLLQRVDRAIAAVAD